MANVPNPDPIQPEASLADPVANGVGARGGTLFDAPAIAAPASQGHPRLVVAHPLPDALDRGLAVIQYRAENLRIVPVFGVAALGVTPRIGHLHITVDDAAWHWVDASGEPLIIQGLASGSHRVRIDLADPTHRVIDSAVVVFEIPVRPSNS